MRVAALLFSLQILTATVVSAQSWDYIAPLKHGRSEALAFQLSTGRILVVGGRDAQNALSSCELYDPLTNTWSDAAPLNIARFRCRGFVLDDGRVFIAGGLLSPGVSITPTTNTCEIYDPQTNSWKLTAAMSSRREGFLACRIPGNKIALMAGLDANTAEYTRTFDIFDAATATMTSMPTMPSCAAATSAIYDPAMNSIVVVGGVGQGFGGYIWKSVQRFSLTTQVWSLLDSLHAPQAQPYALVLNPLNNSLVLFPSFEDYNAGIITEIEVIDPDGHIRVPDHTAPRVVPMSVSIGDSALFLSGIVVARQNGNETFLATCEWYDFKTERISLGPTLKQAMKDQGVIYYHTADPNAPCREFRAVYVFGGVTDEGFTNKCEALIWSAPRALALPALSIGVTACSALDTTIAISNTGCDTVTIQSYASAALLHWTDTTATIAPGESMALHLRGSGFSSGGTYALPVRLTENARTWDTSVSVTLNYTDEGHTPIKPLIKDVLGVAIGDTISVPLYLLTAATSADDLTLTLSYNSDMLQILDPAFDNTSMNGRQLFDVKQRGNTATLSFPGESRFSNSLPFLRLRFRVMLTNTTRSQLTVESISNGSTGQLGCLALETTSALVTTSLRCEEQPMYSLLRKEPIEGLTVKESQGVVNVKVAASLDCVVRIFDALGRELAERSVPQTSTETSFRLPQTGWYTVVATTGGYAQEAKFIIVR